MDQQTASRLPAISLQIVVSEILSINDIAEIFCAIYLAIWLDTILKL